MNHQKDKEHLKADGTKTGETSVPVSLEGLHGTVDVPSHDAGFWRHWWAFVGPAILVSVGYMDPGNWGTDLAGGRRSSSTVCCGWLPWPA